MEAKAYLRYVRISPRKIQIVCDLIRGKDVQTAMAILMQTPKAASEPLMKLLKSACANAENNFSIASPAGILDAAFKAGHDQPGSVQRPSEIGEEQYDALHPGHFEEFDTHVSHLCEEVAEKAHDLTVEPIHDLAENLIGNKIPNKH